jgi:hypothetical protein
MQTLHELLKQQPEPKPSARKPEELGRRYSKIGISAVAAATQFNTAREIKTTSTHVAPADRSSARGWSLHR